MRALSCLLLIGLVAAAPRVAEAQQSDVPGPARVRLGPFGVSPVIAVEDIGVDTNVYNTGTEEVTDFGFAVVPTIEARAGNQRGSLLLQSVTSLVYFSEQSSERSANQQLVADGQLRAQRLTFFAEADYLNTRQRDEFEIDARARRVVWNGEAGARVAVGPKLSVSLSGRYSDTEFREDAFYDGTRLAEMLNGDVKMIIGSVGYAVTPITTFYAVADSARNRFHENPVRDTDATRLLFGADFSPQGLLNGGFRVGYERFDTLSDQLPDYSGLVGAANVSYRIRPETTLGVGWVRDPTYSYSEVEPYFVRNGVTLVVRRQFASRWYAEGRGRAFLLNYRRLGQTLDTSDGRTDSVSGAGGEVGYRIGPRTEVAVGLDYRRRHSEERPERNYDAFRVGTSVTYAF